MTDPQSGSRPDPKTRPCADCGHVWFAGERRHEYVDDRGQGVEDADEGDVVCALCQQVRRRDRSPPRRTSWSG